MARKGENIYKRKDGRWEGRYIKKRVENKAVYGYVYAKTYTEAREKLTAMKYSIQQKSDQADFSHHKDAYVSEISWKWYLSLDPSLKESTRIKYYNIVKNHIDPYYARIQISTVDYGLVTSWCRNLQISNDKSAPHLSSKSVADCLSVLKLILRYATRMKYHTDMTALDASVTTIQDPVRAFSKSEEQVLLEYVQKDIDLFKLGILISFCTGIRIGELCALTWEDISLDRKIIRIQRTMQRIQTPDGPQKTKILVSRPKSSSSIREIPIANSLGSIMEVFHQDTGFVLTGSNTKYIEPRTMQYRFKEVLSSLEINNAHFHTLRHTFATRYMEIVCDAKSLSEILGHSNVTITLNRYVHPSMEIKQKNINRITDLFPSN